MEVPRKKVKHSGIEKIQVPSSKVEDIEVEDKRAKATITKPTTFLGFRAR